MFNNYYYKINICKKGVVTAYICKNKKEKNKWLLEFFTRGMGYSWSIKQYRAIENITKRSFEKFVYSLIKNKDKFVLEDYTVILIQKIFKEKSKNA